MADKNATSAGIGFWGFGSALGITISWSLHESVLWATVHGVLSWFYEPLAKLLGLASWRSPRFSR